MRIALSFTYILKHIEYVEEEKRHTERLLDIINKLKRMTDDVEEQRLCGELISDINNVLLSIRFRIDLLNEIVHEGKHISNELDSNLIKITIE